MFSQKTLTTTALVWIPMAILFTGSVFLTYAAVQQNYRQSLNDPQIQVVQEAARMIAAGESVQKLVPSERIDLTDNLSPFIIFYDADGKVVLGSGILSSQTPIPPHGVFTYTAAHGEDRLTWQPQKGVRIATVIKKTTNGFVLAGRNMREVESRIAILGMMVEFVWTLGLALSLLMTLGIAHHRYKKT